MLEIILQALNHFTACEICMAWMPQIKGKLACMVQRCCKLGSVLDMIALLG